MKKVPLLLQILATNTFDDVSFVIDFLFSGQQLFSNYPISISVLCNAFGMFINNAPWNGETNNVKELSNHWSVNSSINGVDVERWEVVHLSIPIFNVSNIIGERL